MKKFLPLLILLIIPLQIFAVGNLKLNGASEFTLTTLPTNIVLTCDLAQAGNSVHMEIFIDVNVSGNIDPNDMAVDFITLTDGIGWIRDPENTDEDLAGDETGIDGKIKATFPFDKTDNLFQAGVFFIKLTDQDGSTATAKLIVNIQPQPPVITGKITDASNGSPVQYALIFTSTKDEGPNSESSFGISDENGDYFLNVTAGEWEIAAMDMTMGKYENSDTLTTTVGPNETRTLDIQLVPYNTFIQGQTKMENGTPVPGILILTHSLATHSMSFGNSDENGNYNLGVSPGQVAISPANFGFILSQQSNWPEGYYADPPIDTLTVVAGQTATLDFIFKPYTSFVQGICKVGNVPLAGVEITAISTNLQTGQFQLYTGMSDANGEYKLGVFPGIISMLMADKAGYDMTSPLFGYTSITVGEGQTVSDKDFIFQANSEAMLISGTVKYENNSNASDVYVAAVEEDTENADGYRILHTDANGFFQFDDIFEGSWKVGVYKDGYISDPPMFYTIARSGDQITNANFTLKTSTGVTPGNALRLPAQFAVAQNYPNPFNPQFKSAATQINFSIVKTSEVNIIIYNINGQVVKQIRKGQLNGGRHQVLWNGKNEAGKIVPTGMYFYRVIAGAKSLTRRMVIVR